MKTRNFCDIVQLRRPAGRPNALYFLTGPDLAIRPTGATQ
jgi:hypothetical protein